MALERTLAIIKPDAVAKNFIGEILAQIEENGLHIIASKMMYLSKEEVEEFYCEHSKRPFYNSLVKYMSSGPVMVQVFEAENAIHGSDSIQNAGREINFFFTNSEINKQIY